MQAWLITGRSSGVVKALARAVLARCWNAVITARDVATLTEIAESIQKQRSRFHLRSPTGLRPSAALTRFGRIDVLVSNAGY